ncbi:hypothetical protein BT69DRAFT_1247805 [Atractiella rhizophila]|nr:hypothetical protein BT69DRAFT_1247805 [Atractiella rhizophila]
MHWFGFLVRVLFSCISRLPRCLRIKLYHYLVLREHKLGPNYCVKSVTLLPSLGICIKLCGNDVEANTLRFLEMQSITSVPRCLDVVAREDTTFWMVTTFIPGEQLSMKLLGSFDQVQRANFVQSFRSFVQAIRNIHNIHPYAVCSVGGKPFMDYRLNNFDVQPPCDTAGQFLSKLYKYNLKYTSREDLELQRFCDNYGERNTVLTHNDLSFENILADSRTGNVTAVVDWECAAFLPEFWEFTKMLYVVPRGCDRWVEMLWQGRFQRERLFFNRLRDFNVPEVPIS